MGGFTLVSQGKLANILLAARERLGRVSDTAHLDAQVLIAHLLGRPRAWVLAHPETELTAGQEQRVEAALRRLEAGEPLPYVLGLWEFYGLELWLTPDVLIPRPETELLVEQALAWLGAHPQAGMIADVGTGSGCIAIALAVHAPGVQILASDASRPALEVARRNISRHAVQAQVSLVQCDLLPPVARPFDLVCANLPYIPSETLRSLPVAAQEPGLALDGGQDGLDLIRRLLGQLRGKLAQDSLALLEIEASQGEHAKLLAQEHFSHAKITIQQDLAGRDRLLKIETAGKPANAS